MTTTTQTGVAENATSFTQDDAAETFLSRWSEEDPDLKEEQVSENPEDEDQTQTQDEGDELEADEDTSDADESDKDPQESESESDDDEDTETEEKPTKKAKALDEDAVVKVKVDDEELEVSVKDLKRLYGQEAALTKKSQALANQRKEVEDNNKRAAAQLERLHQKASERWEPYSKIDMLVASKQLDVDQFAALRAEAQAAYDDYRFITQEVDQFIKSADVQRQQNMRAQAEEAVKVLAERIPGWNQKVYDDVRKYAVENGMTLENVNHIVDPAAIQILHKAMQFDKAKTIVTKKVNKTPQKVLKTTTAVTTNDVKVDKTKKAKERLRNSGSTEDAANLFLARWNV
jgi:hypothetical protein